MTDWIVFVIRTTSAVSIILSKSVYEGSAEYYEPKILVLTIWVEIPSELFTYDPVDCTAALELELDWKLYS